MWKAIILLAMLMINKECAVVRVYSSFWMPLFQPEVLRYEVYSKFDPEAGKSAREHYKNMYGHRGQKLIADLGNGRGPHDFSDNKVYSDVIFYNRADS